MFDGSQKFCRRLGACAIAAVLLAVPLAAVAQDAPVAAGPQDVPSYARPAEVSTDETIHGRIRSVDGAFSLSVDDDRGFVDTVQLHQGTIINPTGLSLGAGMSVTIQGYNAGSVFEANEIDTPYSYEGPAPTPVYYGPGYWCPGFAYGYGPSFSVAVIFGDGGYGYGPWSYRHQPFYGRPWNGHAYFGGYVGSAPLDRGRVPDNRRPVNPNGRTPTNLERGGSPNGHVPPAFAGHSFAGTNGAAVPAPDYARSGHAQARRTLEFSRTETSRSVAPPAYERAPAGGYTHESSGGAHYARPSERSGGFAHAGGTGRGGSSSGHAH
jgi:hypothetical protein